MTLPPPPHAPATRTQRARLIGQLRLMHTAATVNRAHTRTHSTHTHTHTTTTHYTHSRCCQAEDGVCLPDRLGGAGLETRDCMDFTGVVDIVCHAPFSPRSVPALLPRQNSHRVHTSLLAPSSLPSFALRRPVSSPAQDRGGLPPHAGRGRLGSWI